MARPDTVKLFEKSNVTVRLRGVMEEMHGLCATDRGGTRKSRNVRAGRSAETFEFRRDSYDGVRAALPEPRPFVFGYIRDPESKGLENEPLQGCKYRLLQYMNREYPREYLSRIANPNHKMLTGQDWHRQP